METLNLIPKSCSLQNGDSIYQIDPQDSVFPGYPAVRLLNGTYKSSDRALLEATRTVQACHKHCPVAQICNPAPYTLESRDHNSHGQFRQIIVPQAGEVLKLFEERASARETSLARLELVTTERTATGLMPYTVLALYQSEEFASAESAYEAYSGEHGLAYQRAFALIAQDLGYIQLVNSNGTPTRTATLNGLAGIRHSDLALISPAELQRHNKKKLLRLKGTIKVMPDRVNATDQAGELIFQIH